MIPHFFAIAIVTIVFFALRAKRGKKPIIEDYEKPFAEDEGYMADGKRY